MPRCFFLLPMGNINIATAPRPVPAPVFLLPMGNINALEAAAAAGDVILSTPYGKHKHWPNRWRSVGNQSFYSLWET